MKKLYLFTFLLLVSNAFSQIVNIPDVNFKAYLVGNSAINTNGDSEIQVSEATAFTGTINCTSQIISNLTGIEAFTNITKLFCGSNQLTSLDVSQNVLLNELRCGSNQLTSLNLSQNINLVSLNCMTNQLTTLDLSQNTLLTSVNCSVNQLINLNISQNTNLQTLYCFVNQLPALDISQNLPLIDLQCNNNQLTSLNVDQNTALAILICRSNQITSLNLDQNTSLLLLNCGTNQITSLDLSQNSLITHIQCYNNPLTSLNMINGNNTNVTQYNSQNTPNLICILVDDATYSTANWTNVDPASTFVNNQTECNLLSTNDYELNEAFVVYPNPAKSNISIHTTELIDKVEVFDLFGKKIIESNTTEISIQDLQAGVYLIKIDSQNKTIIKKIIKQ